VTTQAQIWFCSGPQAELDNNYKTIEPIKLRLVKQQKQRCFCRRNNNNRKSEAMRERKRNRNGNHNGDRWPAKNTTKRNETKTKQHLPYDHLCFGIFAA